VIIEDKERNGFRGSRKKVVLMKGGDIKRNRNSVRLWQDGGGIHQQKIFPSGRNGYVRVDALCQSRQRHLSGGLISAQSQYDTSRCISLSNGCFTGSSRSVGLLF